MRCTLYDNLKRTSFNEEATRNFNSMVSAEEVEVIVGEQIEGCYKVVLNAVNEEVVSLSEVRISFFLSLSRLVQSTRDGYALLED